MLRTLRLLLRPRSLWPSLVALLVVAAIAWQKPYAFFVIGGNTGDKQGRVIGIFEVAPLPVTFTLGVGLAPRLMMWERFGTRRMGWVAVGVSLAVVTLPMAAFFALLQFYPAEGDPPARVLWPIAGNVLVAGLVLVSTLGLLGRLAGSLLWLLLLYVGYWLPTRWPAASEALPLTMFLRPDGTLDTATRWPWIAGLAVCAGLIAWQRRLVPIDPAIRPAEERD